MYYPLSKTANILKISEHDILMYRATNHIKYSEKTDKYDVDSVLEQRTMTLDLEKHLKSHPELRTTVENYMSSFSKLKFKLFNDLQKGKVYSNSGINRIHRKLAKEINPKFTSTIADSALSLVF